MACGNLIKFYVRRITIDKKMTIDDVPERWREQVRASSGAPFGTNSA
nr:MAG TPA: hypothetical protein [Caudoviricetes sp.]